MLTRRELFLAGPALLGLPTACVRRTADGGPAIVNDIHARLNTTRVARMVRPTSMAGLEHVVRQARAEGRAISIAGGRHAMGGQQFGADTVLVDTTGMNRVLRLDAEGGLVEVEAGIQWPELVQHLLRAQEGAARQWGIIQKQTGADRLSIGGALSANVHSRGLTLRPLIADVEAFTLVDARGRRLRCARRENAELFRLAIGGYGLFGIIAAVTLRLAVRRPIERVVEVIQLDGLMEAFERRIASGFMFGDFQYATDPTSGDFLHRGVFSCYRPVDRAVPRTPRELSGDEWRRLLYLSHADKKRAFEVYASYYLSTSGQLYWSDTHQMSPYFDNYHEALDRQLGTDTRGTEMITEIYVPRLALTRFMDDARDHLRAGPEVIYGTIRLIEKDDESFLAWARQPWACIIFNLHVVHTSAGLEQASAAFRGLIDLAIRYGGSYYLTYHRWATRAHVEACYPRFVDFLRLKRRYDPEERFQSDWYRHYRTMFASEPAQR